MKGRRLEAGKNTTDSYKDVEEMLALKERSLLIPDTLTASRIASCEPVCQQYLALLGINLRTHTHRFA